ncbi:MAG: Fe-S-containing hydro-lyase [Bacilli bacterium]|jgi:fumarate hydratase subunit beta|nr:Fe-S-containing hydro-lyase [Bacilli bacterium]
MSTIKLETPLTFDKIKDLKSGDQVLLSGVIYTARDAAHKRFIEALDKGEKMPFDVKNQVIYYVGPTPTKPGFAFGSGGPTTSYRMDAYTPRLIEEGLIGMIGKGKRSDTVKEALKGRAVYFAAVGGAAALIGNCVKKAEIIAYEDLQSEAVRRLEVENLPIIVVNDIHGNDLYIQGPQEYLKEKE